MSCHPETFLQCFLLVGLPLLFFVCISMCKTCSLYLMYTCCPYNVRVYRICSPCNSNRRYNLSREFHHFLKKGCILTKFNRPTKYQTDNNSTEAKLSKPTLWFEMPHIGQKAEQLLRSLKKKLSRCLNITNEEIRTRIRQPK